MPLRRRAMAIDCGPESRTTPTPAAPAAVAMATMVSARPLGDPVAETPDGGSREAFRMA
jgi:hypothetical protein